MGSIVLKHPQNHQFRDRELSKEMDGTGGVTVKTFLTSKDRGNLEE